MTCRTCDDREADDYDELWECSGCLHYVHRGCREGGVCMPCYKERRRENFMKEQIREAHAVRNAMGYKKKMHSVFKKLPENRQTPEKPRRRLQRHRKNRKV